MRPKGDVERSMITRLEQTMRSRRGGFGAVSDTTGPFSTSDGRAPPEVPGFDLIRPIGKGGFGEVWLAANRATGPAPRGKDHCRNPIRDR